MYIFNNEFKAEKFLANKEHPLAKEYLEAIDESYKKFKGTVIPELRFSKFRMFDETGDRIVYEDDYFARRILLTSLGVRVWLYKEKEDIEELEDILWAICNEFTWSLPAHVPGIINDDSIPSDTIDLFAAETGHAISEILSLCGNLLHSIIVKRCIEEIFKRIIEPFESEDSQKHCSFGWEYLNSNWAAVCGGAVGMTAIYLIEDEKRLKIITDRAKDACNRFIDSCTDDGVCLEGAAYWGYAMPYYWAFADLLFKKTGENIVVDEEKMKNLAHFPSVISLGNEHAISFSDAPAGGCRFGFGLLCKLHDKYDIPMPEQIHYRGIMNDCSKMCYAVRNIEWFNPDLLHDDTRNTDNYFLSIAQWAVIRSNNAVLAIKGGHNNEPHNHNDIGSFMYIKNGTELAGDLGCPKYTKDYFNENRWNNINVSSFGHSVPEINSYGQHVGSEFRADYFTKTENGVEISFAKSYEKEAGINTLIRRASLDKKDGSISISDSFEFVKTDNVVTERIITRLDTEVRDNSVLLVENGEVKGKIEFFNEGNISVSENSYMKHAVLDDIPVKFNIIDLTVEIKSEECTISYKIS